ncbi:PREDICTED: homeobox-leucine zipper protein HOX11 isoform X2 [Nelumbo nucifera]|uniref:Homeobox-leucine zipper protein HOX11 isoform X2 n=1 Tax=Nelumbo nucifera TaxID=4432 RepID=A0A1U7ZV12_NELNU|nr:PREDICTED: homeobox-leucine zipper protein HOX11 isoform X2 [Nelumbo nucifera]
MELGLSLGDASNAFAFVDKSHKVSAKGLGFCMGLGVGIVNSREDEKLEADERDSALKDSDEMEEKKDSTDPPIQLDLLPPGPVPRKPPSSSQLIFPWPTENGNSEAGSSGHLGATARGFDVNRLPAAEDADDGAAVSSPNSTVSSFQMDFSIYRGGSGGNKRDAETSGNEVEAERASSRASDEEENGLTRKKLRLSKEQSAFLEESFKEHNTLNPKQKLALAKQLNLRPRQVEVWFQNRRARTKLKQTEVDCEYLKRCCETLTEENRRLQKELQELRALKTSHPFYMQLPATTLTMCPSCERVATTSTTPSPTTDATAATTTPIPNKASALSLTKHRFYPFSHAYAHPSAAS